MHNQTEPTPWTRPSTPASHAKYAPTLSVVPNIFMSDLYDLSVVIGRALFEHLRQGLVLCWYMQPPPGSPPAGTH